MKRAYVLITLLIAALGSGGSVYFLQERKFQTALSQKALADLAVTMKVVRDLQRGATFEKVKGLLDASIDTQVRWLMEYESANQSDTEFVRIRSELFSVVKQYWAESPPFVGEQWKSLRSDPDWVEQQKRKAEFVNRNLKSGQPAN